MKTYGAKNVSLKYDNLIKKLKEWTKKNFYFNNNVVHYSTYENVERLTDLPEELMFPEFKPFKSDFDTPLSQLMYNLIALGEYQQNMYDNKIINKLRIENQELLNEMEKNKKKSTPRKNSKSSKVVEKKDES